MSFLKVKKKISWSGISFYCDIWIQCIFLSSESLKQEFSLIILHKILLFCFSNLRKGITLPRVNCRCSSLHFSRNQDTRDIVKKKGSLTYLFTSSLNKKYSPHGFLPNHIPISLPPRNSDYLNLVPHLYFYSNMNILK